MINYNSSNDIKSFLVSENLGMQKKFGQNFLINPEIRKKLIDALDVKAEDEIWEIGPGLGAMTDMLLEKGLKVKAYEIDFGFIRVLKKLFCDNENFSLIEGDCLKTWKSQPRAPFLLGNLPYNIAASLLADFIENGCLFKRMAVTVQKEVALRMAAKAGSKDYSSFSVLCASVYNVKPLMTIKPSSFYPQPNVDSMGVFLESKPHDPYPKHFYPLVRALFASRRKTIKNNLTTFLGSFSVSSENPCQLILNQNSLTGMERAENLDLQAFLSLAKSIDNMRLLKE